MRRSLGPILLISLGLILVLSYLLLGLKSGDSPADGTLAPQVTAPSGTGPAQATAASAVSQSEGSAATSTRTPQPVVPTATEIPAGASLDEELAAPTSPGPTATPDQRRCPLADCINRTGVSGRLEYISAAANAGLPFGNFFDWWLSSEAPVMAGGSDGVQPRYWQMVPVQQGNPGVPWSTIEEVIVARPGAIWIVGNEPDVAWQDNTTAEAYAAIYHEAYEFIKERDPSAMVAIAGVAQPSPLRLAYLDRVLDSYQGLYGVPMPVDIWTVHAFILREQAGSWGVGIPPGMDESEGLLYELDDHDDLIIFQQSLITFRQWMSDRGYGGAPLAVTEFGILHPADYGFPPETVIEFMLGANEFMSTVTGATGDPDDDQRLVQYWFWYSVYDDGDFPTGNLYDAQQESLTTVGQAFRRYLTGQ